LVRTCEKRGIALNLISEIFVHIHSKLNMKINVLLLATILYVITFLFFGACTSSEESQENSASLKESFSNAFLIGSALNEAIASGKDDASQAIVKREFNTVTAENVMKAGPINPQPGEYRFEPADAFVEFGEANDLFIIGHTLVWHNQTPAWFFQNKHGNPNTPEEQIERMRAHIETVAGRYAGRVHAWDVVNEVIDNDGSYRPTTWVEGVGNGDELVKLAFQFASKYAPGTELYYNDFNAWRPAKRDGIARLVRMLLKEGIRIDGVGMQGHWGLNYPKNEYIEAAIDTFASLGVKVMITELDVDVLPLSKEGQIIGMGMSHEQFQLEEFKDFLDPYPDGLPADIQEELTDRYRELFEIFYRKRDKIDRVTLWGVHDGMSWKNGYPIPGRTNYTLLYDRARKAKPALEAVLKIPSTERPD
jgi:endo-1,4-beta-xylanase